MIDDTGFKHLRVTVVVPGLPEAGVVRSKVDEVLEPDLMDAADVRSASPGPQEARV